MNTIFQEGVKDERVRRYIMPKKIIWQNDGVINGEELLNEKPGQVTLSSNKFATLKTGGAIVLDYGCELHGGLQLITQGCGGGPNAKLRIRFGESAMEAMSEIGEKGSTNDHAPRDVEVTVSFMGSMEIGNSGFRFVRIDAIGENASVDIKMARAIFTYEDIPYRGSFVCDDPVVTKIWETGAYTVHLNMQNYLWDGIKRDRLVWIGDMHPETSTIQTVFGYDDCVPRSLDLIRDETPANAWMNGIPTYSMWWIKIQHDWFVQNGDLAYLKQQKPYLKALLANLFDQINPDGTNKIENKFIDWPTEGNAQGKEAGLHAVLTLAMQAAANMCSVLGETDLAKKCADAVTTLKQYVPDPGTCKQAAALMALAGIDCPNKINEEILQKEPAKGLSTFLGYYVLKARGLAGDVAGAVELMKQYWGRMLELGATTFWEDFHLEWAEKDVLPIDQLVPEGKSDIHGDNGDFCYKGFRHSFCHGWASGPTAFISEYILGVKVLEPGCKVVQIKPNLANLNWAAGTYPTPYGELKIKHVKAADGSISTTVDAPKEVTVIY